MEQHDACRAGADQAGEVFEVSELLGAELDAAVARIEGWLPPQEVLPRSKLARMVGLQDVIVPVNSSWPAPCYSTGWGIGGRIIERERITVGYCGDYNEYWPGWWYAQYDRDPNYHSVGPTLLVAAMRAFVASKAGT